MLYQGYFSLFLFERHGREISDVLAHPALIPILQFIFNVAIHSLEHSILTAIVVHSRAVPREFHSLTRSTGSVIITVCNF
jgi:hypothetical protein